MQDGTCNETKTGLLSSKGNVSIGTWKATRTSEAIKNILTMEHVAKLGACKEV